ncbi:SDR family NAD(P)-dependent oxidoreductase, partial [Acidimicrobiaceae bacterium USS-CC1]|nr:SDR family NAD(P)-dependent oxidoreductase [Acidiferrimicrobium australe]
MRLDGARVLLTGATGGIGRALADAFHAAGAELVVSGRRGAPLEELAAPVGARVVVADLA